jgi:hypothetical protein
MGILVVRHGNADIVSGRSGIVGGIKHHVADKSVRGIHQNSITDVDGAATTALAAMLMLSVDSMTLTAAIAVVSVNSRQAHLKNH